MKENETKREAQFPLFIFVPNSMFFIIRNKILRVSLIIVVEKLK